MSEVFDKDGRAVQVIHRNVKVALNLRRVQVESQGAACAGSFQQVGDELCGYRDARFVFAVLAGVAVIREHRSDAPSRCTFEGVDHQEQLEQMIVNGIAARLHDEHVGAAHVFENLKINFTIAKASEFCFSQRDFQMATDALCQGQIRGPRENFKTVVVHETRAPLALCPGLHTSSPEFSSMGNYLLLWRRCGSTEAKQRTQTYVNEC